VGLTAGIFTPLFHTIFLPDLTQVYLMEPTIATLPIFLHARPGLTAASAAGKLNDAKNTIAMTLANRAFIDKA
jgi:hypothetical protein